MDTLGVFLQPASVCCGGRSPSLQPARLGYFTLTLQINVYPRLIQPRGKKYLWKNTLRGCSSQKVKAPPYASTKVA